MSKTRVGVVRGGISPEYEVSLKTGANIIANLSDDYDPVDIFIDRNGEWHIKGLIRPPEEIFPHVDVVWNALHGVYGEDGAIQQLFEAHKIPYTGSKIRSSAVGMFKPLAKEILEKNGIKTPYHRIISREEYEMTTPHDLFRQVFIPAVIKPVNGGSSVKTFLAKTIDDLWERLKEIFKTENKVMVEQYIFGREATIGVIDGFRGVEHYSLLPVEIEKEEGFLWGIKEKMSGKAKEYCPGRFSKEEKEELGKLAVIAHKEIGGRHYSRSDFIISPRGIYFLEINTLPGLSEESLVPRALIAGGTTMPQFLDHVIKLALREK